MYDQESMYEGSMYEQVYPRPTRYRSLRLGNSDDVAGSSLLNHQPLIPIPITNPSIPALTQV